jgi:hypothetical protein
VIYCVIPPELGEELYDALVQHYEDNPNVVVLMDRRGGGDRRRDSSAGGKRQTRDRRRTRVPGTFLSTDPPEAA